MGRRRTGTRHGYVYRRSVREKQGNVVYRQRVLLVFRGHDLRKEATLSLWKELVPRARESAGWSLGLG